MNYRELPDEALVRASDIVAPSGPVPYRRSAWWAKVKAGEAPAPALKTGRLTAWRWGDIRAYLEALAAGRAR